MRQSVVPHIGHFPGLVLKRDGTPVCGGSLEFLAYCQRRLETRSARALPADEPLQTLVKLYRDRTQARELDRSRADEPPADSRDR